MPQSPVRLAHSPEETAQLLGVSRAFVYKMLKAGTLDSVKLGSRRLIRHTTVLALLDQRNDGAA